MNEADTRAKKIDVKLKASGWTEKDIEREYHITNPNPTYSKDKSRLYADYVLRLNNRIIAIVEAKRNTISEREGVQQAKDYADILKVRFCYSTNGEKTYFVDTITKEEYSIEHFHTKEELLAKIKEEDNFWKKRFDRIDFYKDKKEPRYYQEIAVNEVMDAIAREQKKILLNLATGTGKTFIAFQICWKLYNAKWNTLSNSRYPRILFIADRTTLADQAFDAFEPFDKNIVERLTPNSLKNNNGNVNLGYNIYISIFQTLMSGNTPCYKQFQEDFFDFIIIDECHRGGANKESNWREILNYFTSAYKLGLTATPKRDDNIDTYQYFGSPVYTYSLKQGIEDLYLSPFRVKVKKTDIDQYELQEGDIIEQGAGEWFEREDTKIEPDDFYRGKISIKQRDESIVRDFLGNMKPNEKTIVFCPSQEYAAIVRDTINEISQKGDNYCVRVTSNDGVRGDEFLTKFKDVQELYPVILTTSQKLSTGVDAVDVRNIVIMRKISSFEEFKQIIGRGTRICEDKSYFTIYDYTTSYERFKDKEWDGEPLEEIVGSRDSYNDSSDDETEGNKDNVNNGNDTGLDGEGVNSGQEGSEGGDNGGPQDPKPIIIINLGGNRQVNVENTNEYFWYNGKHLSIQEFIEVFLGEQANFFSSHDELLDKWSNPTERQKLLNAIYNAGFTKQELEKLQQTLNLNDCDLLDVFCYIAYNTQIVTREERVRRIREQINIQYQQVAEKEYINNILKAFQFKGSEEIVEEKLPYLITNNGVYSTKQATQRLGGLNKIKSIFNNVQKMLFRA